MKAKRLWLLGALVLAAAKPAAAQLALSTSVPQANLGNPLPMTNGPWVLGEVLFFSKGQLVSDYTWRDKVRGSHGALYTKNDVSADVDSLMSLNKFDKVEPYLFEIPGSPVPPEFATIALTTNTVRLVFGVTEKTVATSTGPVNKPVPPAAISGLVLTPTAYRGTGRFLNPGLGLDFNLAYIIGRLYGRNSYENSPHKVNYIDRVGVWLLTADGKMQIQSESSIRPAVAVGGLGTFMFRDNPQPSVNNPNPSVSVNPQQKSTKLLSAGYFVASKKFGPVRTSLGVQQGSEGDAVAQFSEFLSPDALNFYANQRGQTVRSRTVPFFSAFMLPRPEYPLGIEVMKFNGAALNPVLINFKIGHFLHATFDVGLLKFRGGYDLLGFLQFRYNHFPSR